MRKFRVMLIVAVLAMMLSVATVGWAGQSSLGCDGKNARPSAAVVVINNAKTTFDNEMTRKVTDAIMDRLAERYNVALPSAFTDKFAKAGIVDLAVAEKEDIAKVLRSDGIRYVVFAEIDPFVRKERVGLLHYGLDFTAVVPFRITDLCKNQNLFIGKFVEQSRDSTMIGFGIKNRGVALEALDKAIARMDEALQRHMP